jgi:hypothetical protein
MRGSSKLVFANNSVIIALSVMLSFWACSKSDVKIFTEIDRLPKIDPDYADIVLPPNIAPLNFAVHEEGTAYFIDIYGQNSERDHIKISTKAGEVIIPIGRWKKLLSSNRGGELYVDVYVKNRSHEWIKFRRIKNEIAKEKIDSHVVYRLINPGYVLWWEMGIYQRDLENFKETAIFTNRLTKKNCLNCHSFCRNNPDLMMFHMRAGYGGTMIIRNSDVSKIDTKTDYTMSAGVYPSWHPGGNHIAYSVNIIRQNFHAHQDKSIFVKDTASDLIVYDIRTNTVTTSAKVSSRRMENLPTWSPDGKYLYFISGPEWTEDRRYTDIKYDLMRISYNTETNQWGELDTVLTAAETGKSITFPKISPDGRYLLFCMSDYGYFTIHFSTSDLYLMDLGTGDYRRLDISSEHVDSYHSWSSDGRWFVFSSKRKDGLCSRLYFCYMDSLGDVKKPLLLPQKNLHFYDTFIQNYNVPELIVAPVMVSNWTLAQIAREEPVQAVFDREVDINALSGATRIAEKASGDEVYLQ